MQYIIIGLLIVLSGCAGTHKSPMTRTLKGTNIQHLARALENQGYFIDFKDHRSLKTDWKLSRSDFWGREERTMYTAIENTPIIKFTYYSEMLFNGNWISTSIKKKDLDSHKELLQALNELSREPK